MEYTRLNVLNQRSFLDDLNNKDSVAQVASMINASSKNRSQRRKLEKTLNKVEKIQAKCAQYAKDKADKELEIRADESFMYVFACVGLTLNEDYHWTEDPDQDHGQLTSFFERVTKKMEKYTSQDMGTQDLIDLLDERTGIQLIATRK